MSLLDTASLLLTPNAYKEGKLYSVIPSDGSGDMSVTRATTATRVNSAGLVELVPYNLLSYSEQFNDAYWTKSNSSITANNTTAPDGTMTADKLVENSANDIHFINASSITFIAGTYSISIFAKASERSVLQIFLNGSANVDAYANFNLSSGVVSAFNDCTATIQSVGDGWYRCNLTAIVATSTVPSSYFCVQNSTTATRASSYLGNGTSGIYIWGAQLVEGSTALPYQKTETRLNIPRLDYSNGTCPSLLVEPQRTNLALRSQEFDNASWVKVNASVTANTTASPDGTSNADSLVENTATNLHLTYQFFTSTATTYTYSCYIKPDTRTRAYLRTDTSVGTTRTLFDLTGAGSVVTLAHTSATITLVGNGWYRCTVTFTEGTGAGSRLMAIEGAVGTSISYAGNGLTAFYLYGAQLEVGSYATSYIPTTSASVTRNADSVSKTGISSLIGQQEGTIFFDGVINGCDNSLANLVNSEKNTNTAFSIGYIKASKNIYANVFDGGEKGRIQGGAFEIGQRVKVAYAYKSGDFALYVNGVAIGTSNNTFTFPSTLDDIFIGEVVTFFNWQESILNNVTALWKTRLTNTQLAQLTTI